MLDQLMQLVKENAGEAVISNPAIPNEKNNEAIQTIAGSVFNNLKGQAGAGMLDSVLDMFKGGTGSSASQISQNLTSGAAGDLISKLGIDKATATNIVNQVVPVVMSKLVGKTNDPNDKSIDIEGVIGSLTGKGGGDVIGSLKGLFGGK